MDYSEPLPELFSSSRLMVLNFTDISDTMPPAENIKLFFEEAERQGLNPRLPENRQKFNNSYLKSSGVRYLVSRYGEDRSAMLVGSRIAKEGRTLHIGIDIFAKDLLPVYAPCDGEIVRVGSDDLPHSYGHYLIIKPSAKDQPYIFMGHLSKKLPKLGSVTAGQEIATLGDYLDNENGGWSRHLHLQLLTELPPEGGLPIGYSSVESFPENRQKYPDPMRLFPDWQM